MSEKSTALKVAAGLSATVVALGAAGCGSDGPKYDKRIEQKIGHVITPQMRRIARTAIKLERNSKGQVTAKYLGHGLTEVSGLTSYEAGLNDNNGLDEIDAVMRDYPGTKKPNPSDVVLAGVGSTDNVQGNGPSTSSEVELIAPGQGDLPNKVLVADVASDQILDTKGWTALETGYYANNGQVNSGSQEDTADASEFSVDDNFNPTNPIATAKEIVSLIPDTIPTVIDDFKGN